MQNQASLKMAIVDDDIQMRTMLEDFLKEKYPLAEVSTYITGEDAIKNMVTKPDLVVLDYNLDSASAGSMNGIQFLKKLNQSYPGVPVIFLSGQEKPEVAAYTIQHGAHDYIIKNENIFKRLESTLNSLFGKVKTSANTDGQKSIVKVIIIAGVILLVGILMWKWMK